VLAWGPARGDLKSTGCVCFTMQVLLLLLLVRLARA
jgi:hypothetical protein